MNEDGIAGGDEMRPANGDRADAALGSAYARGIVGGAGAKLGEATYGSKGEDGGTA